MKKLKWIFFAMGFLCSVGGAVARPACYACTNYPQYRFDGANYWEVTDYGYRYFCIEESAYCTWYRPNPILQPNYYVPCREGTLVVVP